MLNAFAVVEVPLAHFEKVCFAKRFFFFLIMADRSYGTILVLLIGKFCYRLSMVLNSRMFRYRGKYIKFVKIH